MSSNINLKELWNKQESEIPETKALIKKANKFKNVLLYKIIATNIILLLTATLLILFWYYYENELLSTKIGFLLIFSAMFSFVVAYNSIVPLLTNKDRSISNNEYLQQLLKLKEKQLFLQTTMINIYLALLFVGVSAVMYEYIMMMPKLFGTIAYVLTIVWFAINWFIFRPRIIKKNQLEIKTLIDKFKALNEQFAD